MDELLDLQEIAQGYYGLTEICGSHLLEGCIAALWQHDHSNNLKLTLTGSISKTFELKYPEEKKTSQLANSWKDRDDATEYGAACIGILLAQKLTQFEVIERAVKKTGIDYWIGNSEDGILFQKKARLEVSGIFRGNDADIDARYSKKSHQTDPSDNTMLPAYISITEFSKPRSKFGQKQK
jgi:hypothetical protein